jgi:hypothetical protein
MPQSISEHLKPSGPKRFYHRRSRTDDNAIVLVRHVFSAKLVVRWLVTCYPYHNRVKCNPLISRRREALRFHTSAV